MAPIDWDKLMKLDVQELQDDMAAAEDMFCVLSEVLSSVYHITFLELKSVVALNLAAAAAAAAGGSRYFLLKSVVFLFAYMSPKKL